MVTHRPAWPSWVRYCPYQFAKSRLTPWGRRSNFLAIVMSESSTFSKLTLRPTDNCPCFCLWCFWVVSQCFPGGIFLFSWRCIWVVFCQFLTVLSAVSPPGLTFPPLLTLWYLMTELRWQSVPTALWPTIIYCSALYRVFTVHPGPCWSTVIVNYSVPKGTEYSTVVVNYSVSKGTHPCVGHSATIQKEFYKDVYSSVLYSSDEKWSDRTVYF